MLGIRHKFKDADGNFHCPLQTLDEFQIADALHQDVERVFEWPDALKRDARIYIAAKIKVENQRNYPMTGGGKA